MRPYEELDDIYNKAMDMVEIGDYDGMYDYLFNKNLNRKEAGYIYKRLME